jgi:hypothetical protein
VDRLVVLENLNQEQELAKQSQEKDDIVQKKKGSKRKSKKKKSARGVKENKGLITPLFKGRVPARCIDITMDRCTDTPATEQNQSNQPERHINAKKDIDTGENSMDLLYESEKQQDNQLHHEHEGTKADLHTGIDSMELLYESEKQQNNQGSMDLLYGTEKQCQNQRPAVHVTNGGLDSSVDSMDLLYESEKQGHNQQDDTMTPGDLDPGLNNMDLLYESEKQEPSQSEQDLGTASNDHDSAVDIMDLLYDSEKQQKDKPIKRSDNYAANKEDRNLVPILSRGKMVSFEAPYEKETYHYHGTATSPSSRPLPNRPRSANAHTRRSPTTGQRKIVPGQSRGQDDIAVGLSKKEPDQGPQVYDIHTGRRMSAIELAEIQKHKEEVYLQWKKSFDRKNAPPVVPPESKYPNGTTETSVRMFHEKMNKLLAPPEESVCEVVQHFSVPQYLNLYRHMDHKDIVISVENCCNCEYHKMSTRHNADEYVTRANAILVGIAQYIHDLTPTARVGVVRADANVTAKSKHSDANSRVGAFEVQIAFKDRSGNLQFDLLHSKLKCSRWPSKSVLEKRLQAFLVKASVEFVTVERQSTWEELYISQPGWSYSRDYEDSSPISWIFDWRTEEEGQEECTPRSHNITMDSPDMDDDVS